jgi:hypothetical protein
MSVYEGATLSLTPWAAQALSDAEIHDVALRAVKAHCRVNVGKSREGEWVIRVSSWALRDGQPVTYVEHRVYGGLHLAHCIGRALNAFEAEAGAWTPDELVTIANQSGIGVSRG